MNAAPARHVVGDPETFGRVAVLLGGESSEREISLITGNAVLEALRARAVDAEALDVPANELVEALRARRIDRVWNALHGGFGEDGSLQGMLRGIGLPHTGSGVLASALAMDKLRSKQLFEAVGLMTPPYRVLRTADELTAAIEQIGLPMAVKPNGEGSSVGVAKVSKASELQLAYDAARRYSDTVLAERWVQGDEYTAGVLQGEVLPLIRIEASAGFYDYQAKYFSDQTRYHCPCGLPEARERELGELALHAFDAVGASGWGRVDFMLDGSGQPLFLELNTVPGMTHHSLVPMAARERGIDFEELVWRILETSFTSPPDSASGASAPAAPSPTGESSDAAS
jgi:D-alanine-D-alanine ligase